MMRPATLNDLSALVELESVCFAQDRFSRRTFRYLLSKAHAFFLVAESVGQLCGYCTVLLRRSSRVARIYNLAVAPDQHGTGLASSLILQAEQEALLRDAARMVLEVRKDNARAIAFYAKQGYQEFGCFDNYYEDKMSALRMAKALHI